MCDIEWPWQYNFPPFFTLQPNQDTRKKQIEAWRNIVLEYCQKNKLYILDINEISSSPLFYNKSINRKLDRDDIVIMLDELCATGNIEWCDGNKQRCYVYWHTLEEWATFVYDWAVSNGMTNSVCTIFELTSGANCENEPFYGLDENVMIKALKVLESERKAEVFDGNEGVKFYK